MFNGRRVAVFRLPTDVPCSRRSPLVVPVPRPAFVFPAFEWDDGSTALTR